MVNFTDTLAFKSPPNFIAKCRIKNKRLTAESAKNAEENQNVKTQKRTVLRYCRFAVLP
jgi:hypothetical protein